MKRGTLFFILPGLFVLLIFTNIHAQVTISFSQPSPNQWRFEDMWNVLITNTGNTDLNIYLFGTLEEAIQGKIAEATSANFILPKNYAGPLQSGWLKPVNNKYFNSKYEDVARKTGTMPDGKYFICVTVYTVENRELAKDCFEQTIANMSPPELTYPFNETKLNDRQPVFQWIPPMPAPFGEIISYKLKIVELLDGQVPIEAMESNPAFFTKGSFRSPSFQFPLSARPFVAGNSYAWQVTAYGKNYEIGKSQVWKFMYGNNYQIKVDSLIFRKRPDPDTKYPVLYDFALYVTNENPGTANLSVTGITKTTPSSDAPITLPDEMSVTIRSGAQGVMKGVTFTGKTHVKNICIEIKLEDQLSPKSNSVITEECNPPWGPPIDPNL